MTKEQILEMNPGVELNAEVAEKAIGRIVVNDATLGYMERSADQQGSVWGMLKPYSEQMSAAETVIERMVSIGFEDAIYWADFGDGTYTEPEAICKAALLAVLDSAG